ncbi:MAG: type II toxin-antitoxin system PemK/MazF family toxin, partial [Proteobacteria bacterium]|nr:type II toxin-antitoxin system PemK/MazF family toxin [Pseudomonadota bacterium]
SANARLHGVVTVIPCSTKAQSSKWAFALHTTIDGKAAWAICNYPTTVAVSRLIPNKPNIVRMPDDEFNHMLKLVHGYLPQPR